jgi:hypothetical protein
MEGSISAATSYRSASGPRYRATGGYQTGNRTATGLVLKRVFLLGQLALLLALPRK